jgi:hypothetical protein
MHIGTLRTHARHLLGYPGQAFMPAVPQVRWLPLGASHRVPAAQECLPLRGTAGGRASARRQLQRAVLPVQLAVGGGAAAGGTGRQRGGRSVQMGLCWALNDSLAGGMPGRP